MEKFITLSLTDGAKAMNISKVALFNRYKKGSIKGYKKGRILYLDIPSRDIKNNIEDIKIANEDMQNSNNKFLYNKIEILENQICELKSLLTNINVFVNDLANSKYRLIINDNELILLNGKEYKIIETINKDKDLYMKAKADDEMKSIYLKNSLRISQSAFSNVKRWKNSQNIL